MRKGVSSDVYEGKRQAKNVKKGGERGEEKKSEEEKKMMKKKMMRDSPNPGGE